MISSQQTGSGDGAGSALVFSLLTLNSKSVCFYTDAGFHKDKNDV